MFQIINNIINYTTSSQYMTTYDQYIIGVCSGIILILTVVTTDWLKQLYKSLVNKIR